MQTANALVALGGDTRNTVPKTVTPAQVLLLQAIHGEQAVFDLEPADDIDRGAREELDRLRQMYLARNEDGRPIILDVLPSAAAVPEDFDALDLPEEFWKPQSRAKPAPKKAKRGGSRKKATNATKGDDQEESEGDAEGSDEDKSDDVMG